jgi:hypothetical protein
MLEKLSTTELHPQFHLSLLFFSLVVLGFKLRVLHLLGRCSISQVMPLASFYLYFSDRVSHFCSRGSQTAILLPMLSAQVGPKV